ncbi:L,D-transpeptidase family protein [Adlercreutzia shanghongiae]|uniref:L,D-transpeptidase family protein n=1 Tax=Adlercreutzia shanghongiae TaxID=3111773 RepID=A0ABU6J0B8_9ACTN|nr:L,D-transpeptidase family protein [Adlercreutzia sp. R22]MEC4295518.1 L,D-transpeptidase family protein [Adlercreutzia sp. R22]
MVLALAPAAAFAADGDAVDGSTVVASEPVESPLAADAQLADLPKDANGLNAQGADGGLASSSAADEAVSDEPASGEAGIVQPEEPAEPVKPEEPVVPGLKIAGDHLQFVNPDGSLVRSDWKTVDGKRYYFDAAGNSVRWSYKIGDYWYYFNRNCVMQTGWVTWNADGLKSYFGADGKALTKWQTIDGKRYYFNPSTAKSVRWEQKIDGAWYYFNGQSQMQKGWVTWKADGLKSYFGADGKALTKWQTIDGKRYYFNPSTAKSVRWEQKIDGAWYYFNGQSQMQTGVVTWNAAGLKSVYGSDGKRLTGWQKVGGKTYYINPSTAKSVRWEQKIDGAWYYFNGQSQMQTGVVTWNADGLKSVYGSDGKRLTGWQKVGGKTYYINPSTAKSVRWEQKIDGAWYYFNGQSQMQTGVVTWNADGLKSVYGSDGKRLTGWQKVGGKTYYINPSTAKSVRWEQKIGGKWYYFNGQSQMQTGWLKWSGKQLWSYYWSDGVRASGTQTIGGFRYTFDANGRTATKPVSIPRDQYDMNQKAQKYSSGTNYLILVNRSTHKVGIYYKRPGYWECTNYFSCVTGKPSTPTITGSFKTTGGKRSSLSTDSRAKYCTQITGGYFFHTILASNNELGKSLSHGCIRLSYSSAKWIYQHIHAGTRVVIY